MPAVDEAEPGFPDAGAMPAYFARLAGFFGRPKYDDFHLALSRGRTAHKIAYAVAHRAAQFRGTAFLVGLLLYLLLPGLRVVPDADVVFSGDTKNNRRALDEVGELLAHRRDLRTGRAAKRAGIGLRLRRWRTLGVIWRASALIPERRGRGSFLSLQLLVGAAALAFYEIELARRTCRVIVLANDHSPIPTAIMFAARRHRIATVYRQHAPVTPEFPPLRVDLALLYDEISCDAYREAARNDGVGDGNATMMRILSPFADRGRPVDSSRPVRTVGICLSLVWLADPIEALIADLLSGGRVEAIVLRAHPANRQNIDRLLRHRGVAMEVPGVPIDEFARSVDVAIVPNSGICLELLHLGVPTLYRAGMDALGHDLYGFVEAKIIPDWTHRDIAEIDRGGDFFDAAWRARFARFDATQLSTPEAMRAEASRALETLLDRAR